MKKKSNGMDKIIFYWLLSLSARAKSAVGLTLPPVSFHVADRGCQTPGNDWFEV